MKKIFKMIVIVIVILFLGILTLFCIKINKISLIENIRQKIAQVGENIQTANEITTIDVTDLEDNGDLEHEHIIKTMYDENEVTHNYNVVWALGYESCRDDNYAVYICSCGYSYIWHKPCVWKGQYTCNTYDHGLLCAVCGQVIAYNYYYGAY